MTTSSTSHAGGIWQVNENCLNCLTCIDLASSNFTNDWSKDNPHGRTRVSQQPRDSVEFEAMTQAKEQCCVQAIVLVEQRDIP